MKLRDVVLWLLLRLTYKKSPPPSNIKKILIISNTAIGDTVFSTPLFRETKLAFPNSTVTLVLNPRNYELFTTNPYIDTILLYRGRWSGFAGLILRLKKESFDVAIISHSNEPQATPLCALSGIKTILKVPNFKNEFKAFHYNPPTPMITDDYTVLNRLKNLEFLGFPSKNTRVELFLKDTWKEGAKSFLNGFSEYKKIGIQIGASTVSQQWFDDRWFELAKMLLELENIAIVFTGSPSEARRAQKVASKLQSKKVLVSAGTLSLGEGAALIGELDLFISADTGPLHIAVALQTPTLSLFAVAEPACSLPNYDRDLHRFIKVPKTCDPCVGKRCKYQKCMEQIEVKSVYDAARERF